MNATVKAKRPHSAPRFADRTARDHEEEDVQFIKAKLANSELLEAKADEFDRKSLEEAIAAGERLAKKFTEFKDPTHPYYRRQGAWLDENGISQPRANEAVRLHEWRDKLTPGVTFGKKAALRLIKESKDAEKAAKQPEVPAVEDRGQETNGTAAPPVAPVEVAAGPVVLPAPPHDRPVESNGPTNPPTGDPGSVWKPEKEDVYYFAPPGGKVGKTIGVEVTAVDEKAKTVSLKSLDGSEEAWADVSWDELGEFEPPKRAGTGSEGLPAKIANGASESETNGATKGGPGKSAKRKPNGDEDVGDDGSVDFIPTLTREEDEEYRPLLEYLMGELQLPTVKAAVFHAIKSDYESLKALSEGGRHD